MASPNPCGYALPGVTLRSPRAEWELWGGVNPCSSETYAALCKAHFVVEGVFRLAVGPLTDADIFAEC